MWMLSDSSLNVSWGSTHTVYCQPSHLNPKIYTSWAVALAHLYREPCRSCHQTYPCFWPSTHKLAVWTLILNTIQPRAITVWHLHSSGPWSRCGDRAWWYSSDHQNLRNTVKVTSFWKIFSLDDPVLHHSITHSCCNIIQDDLRSDKMSWMEVLLWGKHHKWDLPCKSCDCSHCATQNLHGRIQMSWNEADIIKAKPTQKTHPIIDEDGLLRVEGHLQVWQKKKSTHI